MIVYRLSKKEYINDVSGRGAEKSGGRWNNKGLPALYTAGSRALAVLEIAVHVPLGIMPTEYYMATIEFPDNASILKIETTDLPAKWNSNPLIKATQNIGDDFLKDGKYLILQVPSASVNGDFNYVINPAHPDFKTIKIKFTQAFEFDSRLFKK